MDEKLPEEFREIAEEKLLSFEDLNKDLENPRTRKRDPISFDEWMQKTLQDKEIDIQSIQNKERYNKNSVKYWKWRFQPENIIAGPKEYLHDGDESLFILEDDYEPEGMFIYAKPDETMEVMGMQIPQMERVLYGINQQDSRAYILQGEMDAEEFMYGREKFQAMWGRKLTSSL